MVVSMALSGSGGNGSTSTTKEVSTAVVVVEMAAKTRIVEEVAAAKAAE
jgi:hypothetical protein